MVVAIGRCRHMGLTGLMAWNGGVLKLYNDIPSLMGYLSAALILYKMGMGKVNRFFEWASGFGYELYLVHSLVFTIMTRLFATSIPLPVLLVSNFVAAYVLAYLYKWFLWKTKLLK